MEILILVSCLFILSKNDSHSSELIEIHWLDNLNVSKLFFIHVSKN